MLAEGSGRGFLELLFLGRAVQGRDRRVAAGDCRHQLVEEAGADKLLMRHRAVTVVALLGKLLFLEANKKRRTARSHSIQVWIRAERQELVEFVALDDFLEQAGS